jgi:AraC family transcriptional regulator of adaptative response / DNA-3-methyladenine glycosylase II
LENCIFVPTAAAAQEAGFRPCLRCRPESSPQLDAWRGTSATVSRALKLIESGALDHDGVGTLADRLGIGSRQLRRLFSQHVGAAPITVAQTRRVLLAKQLIHQTDLPMIQVALASGFGSVRRFNEAFQRLYGRPPSALRRGATAASAQTSISLLLPYKPPYDWRSMIDFLAARAIDGLELVTCDSYQRIVEVDGVIGSVEVTHVPEQASLLAKVHLPRSSVLPAIIARIRRMFDLGAEPTAISEALSADRLLAPLVEARPGMRVPGAWDGFEIAVRAILGQHISVKAATRVAARLVAALGRPVNEPALPTGPSFLFPRPAQFAPGALSVLQLPRARLSALVNLAEAARADSRLFEPRGSLPESVAALRRIAGIGEWTAQYIAMRALGESDAFLAGDVGLQRKLAGHGPRPAARQLLARAERWRPWRAYAMLYLWTAEHEQELEIIPHRERICDALTA